MVRILPRVVATLALALATPPAAAEWREASTDHFLIYADASDKWMRGFAERLERAAGAMDKLRPGSDRGGVASNRVVIYAIPSFEAVQKLCGRCGSVAGFYVPRVGQSVAFSARTSTTGDSEMSSDIVLLHEYAHHVLLSSTDLAYPKWISEGMAEFLSTMRVLPDGGVEIGHPAQHRAYNIVNETMPIEELLASVGGNDSMSQDIFYGRAWMLVHMLMFDGARRGQIDQYLAGLNSGKPNLDAARGAFGDLKKLGRELQLYVRKSIKFARLPADMIKSGEVKLRVLSPGETAMMPVRLRSDRGVSPKEALALVPDARRRAAPFGGDGAAQAFLAEVEYDAKNDAQAEAAADRALAADPRSVEALVYKGRVRMRRAAAAPGDAAKWKDARSWFVKANKVDPDAAEPLLLYYQSFAAAGEEPTANAALGLFRSFELSPHDPGLRMITAFQYLSDGKVVESRRTLLPLAYSPHVPADRNVAARLVAMIDAKTPADDILQEARKSTDADGDEP